MISIHSAAIHLPATITVPACQLYVGIQRHLVSLNLCLGDPSLVLSVKGPPLSSAADIGKYHLICCYTRYQSTLLISSILSFSNCHKLQITHAHKITFCPPFT